MQHRRLSWSSRITIHFAGLILGGILLTGHAAAQSTPAQTCLPPPAGLVGWWPGDGNADDIVGSNGGTLQNGATFAPGKVGQAFSFDGIDDEVFVNSTFPFHTPGDATLDFWLKFSPLGHQSVFWTRPDDDDGNRFNIFVNGDGTFGFDYRTPSGDLHELVGSGGIWTGVPIAPDTWTLLAITRVGNVYSVYRDGALVASGTDVSPDLPTSTGWQFSGRSGYIYQGFLDEIEVYDRALSALEIQAIYNAGSSGKCKAPSLISNGGFEQGTNPGPSFTTLPAGSTAMTNWRVTSGTVDYIGPYWTAAAGQRSVDLNGNDPGAISQAFKTKPGTTYAVRFSMAGNPDGPPATKRLHVSADGDTAELTFNTEGRSREDMGYEKRTVLFTATSPQTTLAFTTLTPGPYGPAIDDVTVNETALGNVDNQVRFTPESGSYHTTADVTGCPSGFGGKFSFTATLGAKPTSPPLSDLVVKVAQLSNGNLLQNSDGGPSGVGGLLTIPRNLGPSYSDGVLTHGETIQHIPFNICLTSKASFTFFVDVLGTTVKQ